MLRHNVSRAVRFLRRRSRWRQRDLGIRAGASREMVSRIERGQIETMTVGSLHRVASALNASLHVELRWHGEQLDRLMDAGHAKVQEAVVGQVRHAGWRVEVEVSFNWYGDRGRCDAVAYHPPTGTLLIVEVKTRLADVQEMLGRLDVKTRLGPQIARQLAWPAPARVIPCLVIADARTARRVVASHAELFARFTLRGRAARQWLAARPLRAGQRPPALRVRVKFTWHERAAQVRSTAGARCARGVNLTKATRRRVTQCEFVPRHGRAVRTRAPHVNSARPGTLAACHRGRRSSRGIGTGPACRSNLDFQTSAA